MSDILFVRGCDNDGEEEEEYDNRYGVEFKIQNAIAWEENDIRFGSSIFSFRDIFFFASRFSSVPKVLLLKIRKLMKKSGRMVQLTFLFSTVGTELSF